MTVTSEFGLEKHFSLYKAVLMCVSLDQVLFSIYLIGHSNQLVVLFKCSAHVCSVVITSVVLLVSVFLLNLKNDALTRRTVMSSSVMICLHHHILTHCFHCFVSWHLGMQLGDVIVSWVAIFSYSSVWTYLIFVHSWGCYSSLTFVKKKIESTLLNDDNIKDETAVQFNKQPKWFFSLH